MLRKQLTIHGQTCAMAALAYAEVGKTQCSIVDCLWQQYADFLQKRLADTDGASHICPDPEIEDQNDPKILDLVRNELQDTLVSMADAYNLPNTHELIVQIKHELKVRLTRRSGVQRELYSSAWFTMMREVHNRDLFAWATCTMGRAAGAPRSLPRLWIDEIFGQDWDRLKSQRLPPQVSLKNVSSAVGHQQNEPWFRCDVNGQSLRRSSDFLRIR